MPSKATPLAPRFWAKVDQRGPDECWPWLRRCDRDGYGKAYVEYLPGGKQRYERAHRVAYFLTHGHWPAIGRHSCDNPPCCNPAHILDGTARDNAQDMWARGRGHYNGIPWTGPRDSRGRFTSGVRADPASRR